MSDNEIAENPYLSPTTNDHRLGNASRSFQVGRDEIHTVCVETSLWTGLRTHSINAAGNSTPAQRGPCQFEVGERERHHVVIQVEKTGRTSALIDGELVEHNLFPRQRAVIIALIALVSVLVVALVYLAIRLIFNA